jgi:ADP-ribosyl-[dinitrogen reductase] hydrolase
MNADSLRDRYRGSLIGLAVGDALGAAVEFQPPGTFEPVTEMRGGGPHNLEPGYWTDDTSMALCLAESLLEQRGFHPQDQMQRYVRWWQEGHLSSTKRCFDIGNTTADALAKFRRTGEPYCGSTHEHSAGNGSLMRLAPVPLYYRTDAERAIALAGDSSRTTHGNRVAVDACRYMAGLILGALGGVSKEELLSPSYSPIADYWTARSLHEVIARIANGSFKSKSADEVKGSGYVAECLEAALWAFHNGGDFREGCLLAVNLGNDADTTGAVYGQLAGAFYGADAIPRTWCDALALCPLIIDFADRLYAASAP